MLKLFVLNVLFFAVLGVSYGAVEDRKWFRYQSEHFTVFSDRNPKKAIEQLEKLEMFHNAVLTITGTKDFQIKHPTKIFLLNRSKQVRTLFKVKKAIGFMRPGVRANLIVAGNETNSLYQDNEIVYHEYVHYVVRNASAFRYPTWYDEGFADALSTIKEKDGKLVVGDIPLVRGYSYQNETRQPLGDILLATSTWNLKSSKRAGFYASSWLFVHYLMFSQDARELKLVSKNNDYLSRINQGQDRERAFEAAFAMSIDEMDKRLKRYAKGGLPAYSLNLENFAYNKEVKQTRMTRDEIAYELAYQIVGDNPKQAQRMMKKSVENNPDDMRALAALGVTYQMQGDFVTALDMLKKAVEQNPQDYLLHIEYADALSQACGVEDLEVECAKPPFQATALSHYKKAHTLAPQLLETNFVYASNLVKVGEHIEAIPLLQTAVGLLPSHYPSTMLLGSAYLGSNDLDKAERHLNRAMGWAADYPSEQARLRVLLQSLELARRSQRDE